VARLALFAHYSITLQRAETTPSRTTTGSSPPEHDATGKLIGSEPLKQHVQSNHARAEKEDTVQRPCLRAPMRRVLEFDAIYEEWFEEVSRWVRAMGGPEADREDLVQEVFVTVYRRLPDFDGQNVPGWLYRIARRRVRDFRRLRWFRLFFGKSDVSDRLASSGQAPDAELRRKESEQNLTRMLSKLPEPQRVAFVLFEIEGHSGDEIARLQSVPINTVWARIRKARIKLMAQIQRMPQYREGRGSE
jgi:RNA polymerase sigma-70 factor, ECF subfamily